MVKEIQVQPGQRFGMLVVIREADRVFVGAKKVPVRTFEVQCDCGNVIVTRLGYLRSGRSRSCGCVRVKIGGISRTHGLSGTPEYISWQAMRTRCHNSNQKSYRNYGARGIKVCERWNDFSTFLEDMGPKPTPHHSIDRIDVNGNYEPGNCRWATSAEQSNNKRQNVLLDHGGVTMTLTQWADQIGLSRRALSHRLKSGWSVDRALSTPSMKGGAQ